MKRKTIIRTLTLAILCLTAKGCSNSISEEFEETRKVLYVDSVWIKGPGQINTMQVDPIYFARTSDGQVHQSRGKIEVGDSFIYIFRRKK